MKIIKLATIIIIALLIISGCSSDSEYQSYDLYGKVINNSQANETPLENVNVRILNTQMEEETNSEGIFKFTNLKKGIYDLSFEKGGFKDVKKRDIDVSITQDMGQIKMSSSPLGPLEPSGNATVKGRLV